MSKGRRAVPQAYLFLTQNDIPGQNGHVANGAGKAGKFSRNGTMPKHGRQSANGKHSETLDASAGISCLGKFKKLEIQLKEVQRSIIKKFQHLLSEIAGKTCSSKEINQALAETVRRLADRLQKRIRSPEGHSATLRWKEAGGAKYGIFELRAQVEGKAETEFASVRLPKKLILTGLPKDRRRAR